MHIYIYIYIDLYIDLYIYIYIGYACAKISGCVSLFLCGPLITAFLFSCSILGECRGSGTAGRDQLTFCRKC